MGSVELGCTKPENLDCVVLDGLMDGDVALAERSVLRFRGSAKADALELPPVKVMVIEVRRPQFSMDIPQRTLGAESFSGKKRVLEAVAAVPGVTVAPDADVHSAGILCAIGLSETQAVAPLVKSRALGQIIVSTRRAGVRVFPAGFELQEGRIEDTNTPCLVNIFGVELHDVTAGLVPVDGGEVPGLFHPLGLHTDDGADLAAWLFGCRVPHVAGDRMTEIVTALDRTDFDADNQSTIVVSIITSHSRAADVLLQRFREMLPEGVRATVLADRGFGTAPHENRRRAGRPHHRHRIAACGGNRTKHRIHAMWNQLPTDWGESESA